MKADLHVHTEFSDGKASPQVMVEAAESGGLDIVAITDHGPALHVGMKEEQIPTYLSILEEIRREANLRLLVGLEANIVNEHGEIDISEEVRGRLDILIVGIHKLWKVSDPREMALTYLHSLLNSIKRNRIDVIAHPFQFHGDLSQYLTMEEIAELLEVASERGTAMEVNEKYRAPNEGFYQACLEHGVRISVGTDSHRPETVGKFGWVGTILRRIGATESDLLTGKFFCDTL